MRNSHPIVVIEDDMIDFMTIKRAFKEINVLNEIIHLQNGEDALAYFQRSAMENKTHSLILLDINMPRMNGIEFLHAARSQHGLLNTPIVILTTSKEEKDREESFKMNVAGYMIKPVDYGNFVDLLRALDNYWTLSEMPD